MKRIIAVFIFLISAGIIFGLDIDGNFITEFRVSMEDGSYLFNQENGTIGIEHQVDDNLFAAAKIRFRYFNSPLGLQSGSNIMSARELSILAAIGPVEISLDEAYFEYMNFIVTGLDLSMGKQRIRWGAADVLNPTDLLNPLDLSDPFNFGKKIPSLAVSLKYTFPESEAFIQGVWEPFSPVARLNPLVTNGIESRLLAAPSTFSSVNSNAWTAVTPAAELANSLLAFKIGVPIAGFDISANFVYRISDMPIVSTINAATPVGDVSDYSLSYYREYEAGIDVVKDWDVLLTWAEVAVFWQEEQITVTTITTPSLTITNTALSAEPYVKYTIGMDKQFGSLFYMNIQYSHGFFTERGNSGPGRLQDYLMIRLETSLLDDKLVIGLTGLGNVNNFYEAFGQSDIFGYIGENYGVSGGFDIAYKPSLSVTISIGLMVFEGKDTTNIGSMKDRDFFFLKAEFFF